MNRNRWTALAVVASLLVVTGVAYGVTGGGGSAATASAPITTSSTTSTPTSTSTSESTTSTTVATTTSTTPASTSTSASGPAGVVLRKGSRGPEVAALQRRLGELRLDPGVVDGVFGQPTVYAVQAFQKMNGMGPSGVVGPEVRAALESPAPLIPLAPNGGPNRVEVDLRRQLLSVYKDGALKLVSHTSTGSGKKYCVEGGCNNTAITPIGAFRFAWRYTGWRQSRLGKLYNPVYFTNDGVAVHGAESVPTYPASHGCVRLPMHIAEYFPSLVKRGDPIYVTDGRDVGPPPPTPSGPPPSDPPTSPGESTTTTSTPAPSSTTSTTSPSTTTTSTTSPSPTTSPTTATTVPPI